MLLAEAKMKASSLGVLLPWIAGVMSLSAAPPHPATDAEIRAALGKSVSLLQQTTKTWWQTQTCVSCHHQTLPLMAFSLARERGVAVDQAVLQEEVNRTFAGLTSLDRAIENTHLIDATLDYGNWLVGAQAAGVPPGVTTAVYARMIARRQLEDGGWAVNDMRPPQSYSRFTAAAVALRALKSYGAPEMSAEIQGRIARAKRWLLETPPRDTEDRARQLLGLHLAGATTGDLKAAADRLLSEQQPDGGWRQIPGRSSDAYATGETLVALHVAGGLAVNTAAYQRGIGYLLGSQFPDGSWLVKTRLPDQRAVSPPYFETGFPYKEHQVISSMGTSWASMALLYALPKTAAALPALDFSRIAPPRPQAWIETALFGSTREFEALLDRGLDPNSHTAEGTTALMMAAPDFDKVKLLIAHGADVNARARSGFTALIVAAGYRGTTEVMRTLLDHGAQVKNPPGVRVLFHTNPALFAALSGEAEKISLLAAHAGELSRPMLLIGQFQTTPLSAASQQGETAVAEALVRHGAAIEEQDSDGITAVEWASLSDHPDTVRALVKLGADVNHVDKFGLTALLHAAQTYFTDTRTIEALLAAGADLKARTPQGLTALDLARKYDYPEVRATLERAATKVAGL
jgi:ankyrin repeat protein